MQVCVVSLGSQGSVAFNRQGECAMATPAAVHVADTVGAGDCHTAGFLHAYLAGAPLAVSVTDFSLLVIPFSRRPGTL